MLNSHCEDYTFFFHVEEAIQLASAFSKYVHAYTCGMQMEDINISRCMLSPRYVDYCDV